MEIIIFGCVKIRSGFCKIFCGYNKIITWVWFSIDTSIFRFSVDVWPVKIFTSVVYYRTLNECIEIFKYSGNIKTLGAYCEILGVYNKIISVEVVGFSTDILGFSMDTLIKFLA